MLLVFRATYLQEKNDLEAGNTGYWQAQFTMSDKSYSDIMAPNRAEQDSYNLLNLRAGITNDDWFAEMYVDNVTDERAEISNTFVFDRQRVAIIRPFNNRIEVQIKILAKSFYYQGS